MKKLLSLLALSLVIFISSCSKNYQETLPVCQFVSATPYGQDSLLITGQVSSNGTSAIQYVGFAYSDQPNFDILSNQILGNGTSGQFYIAIPAYPDSTYYFKCFAANEYGYGVSPNFKYKMPYPKPDSAPCSLVSNQLIDDGNHWAMAYINPTSGFGSYGIQATDASSYEIISIYFNQVPTNGIYATDGSEQDFIDNPRNRFSVLIVMGNFTTFTVNSGGQVYVAQNANGSTTISFFSLNYTAFSSTISLSGKITY